MKTFTLAFIVFVGIAAALAAIGGFNFPCLAAALFFALTVAILGSAFSAAVSSTTKEF